MRRTLPRSVEPCPKIAKYLLTPCFSRPRTSASESVASTSLGSAPPAMAAARPPACLMARARSRIGEGPSPSGLRVSMTGLSFHSQTLRQSGALGGVSIGFAVAECPGQALDNQEQPARNRDDDQRGIIG